MASVHSITSPSPCIRLTLRSVPTMSSAYLTPPTTPPHTITPKRMSQPQTPHPTGSLPTFRLPSQPTIVLKAPGDDTIARFQQLASYYWRHPETTNCSVRKSFFLRISSCMATCRRKSLKPGCTRGGMSEMHSAKDP